MTENKLNIKLEFSGGAELLFGNKKKHLIQLEQASQNCKIIFYYLKAGLKFLSQCANRNLFKIGYLVWSLAKKFDQKVGFFLLNYRKLLENINQ